MEKMNTTGNELDEMMKEIGDVNKDNLFDKIKMFLEVIEQEKSQRVYKHTATISIVLCILNVVHQMYKPTRGEMNVILMKLITFILYPGENVGLGIYRYSALLNSKNEGYFKNINDDVLSALFSAARKAIQEVKDLSEEDKEHLKNIASGILPWGFRPMPPQEANDQESITKDALREESEKAEAAIEEGTIVNDEETPDREASEVASNVVEGVFERKDTDPEVDK